MTISIWLSYPCAEERMLDEVRAPATVKRSTAGRAFWMAVEVSREVLSAAEILSAAHPLRALDVLRARTPLESAKTTN